jgi:ribose transport system permease protein
MMDKNTLFQKQAAPSSVPLRTDGALQRAQRFFIGENRWIWLGTILLFVVSAVIAPASLSRNSLMGMLPFAGILAIVAVGQTVVIQQRGIDMSATGLVSFGGIVCIAYAFTGTTGLVCGVVISIAAAALIGLVSGYLTARLAITPLIATLATNALVMGAVRMISRNRSLAAPPELLAFSHGSLFGLPYSLWLALLFIAVASVLTKYTVIGNRFVAVGVNSEAASAAGILVARYQVGAYIASAVCFAIAGMLLAGYIAVASNRAGDGYLLPSIAAVVVGGTPFTGGRGSVVASGVAALFMSQLSQMVLTLGASSAQQILVTALAILLAVAIKHIPRFLGFRG